MIIIECEQGSPEWFEARMFIPTASEFGKLITPAKLQPSKQADTYINKLVAAWILGKGEESYQSSDMLRGIEIEQEARDFYAFHTDYEVKQVGFCLADNKQYGCSPDGLIAGEGGLEIKSCSPGVHTGYLIKNKVPVIHRLQILGSLLITGYEWWDFLSYHPDMKPLIIRTWRKDVEDDLKILEKALISVNKIIYDKKKILTDLGVV